jgi:hypothetical protein
MDTQAIERMRILASVIPRELATEESALNKSTVLSKPADPGVAAGDQRTTI